MSFEGRNILLVHMQSQIKPSFLVSFPKDSKHLKDAMGVFHEYRGKLMTDERKTDERAFKWNCTKDSHDIYYVGTRL